MKISFIISEDENLGVEYLSYYLKKHGHTVDLVFNPRQFSKAYLRNKFLARLFDWTKINILELKQQNPNLVAFSCLTASYQWALAMAREIKKEIKKPILFGGLHPTLMPELVIQNPEVDMICIGEGEEAILELAESFDRGENRTNINNFWFKKGGKVIKNELKPLEENIDKYRMDRSLFWERLPANYRKNAYFITSRGCPFNCTYCGNEQKRKIYCGQGKFLRQKGVDSAIQELKELKERYKTKNILFVDDILTMDRKWFFKFIKRYKKEIDLPFTCFVHPKLFDKKIARWLKYAGCKLIWYGIQSGSEKVRSKFLNRYETNEEIIQVAKICREIGLKYMVDHIFDIPFDNDIQESIKLYNAVRPYMLNCYNLLYFPTAKIIDYALEAQILTPDDVAKINQGKTIVYQTGALSVKSKEARDNYNKYALFLTLIPLLPPKIVDQIRQKDRLLNLFSRLPLFFIPLIKALLNFRVHHGFVPLAVIKTELFWTRKFILIKLRLAFQNFSHYLKGLKTYYYHLHENND